MDDSREITVSERELIDAVMNITRDDESTKELINGTPLLMVTFTIFVMKIFDYVYEQQKSIQENVNKINEKLKED